MPTYDVKCLNCDNTEEIFSSFDQLKKNLENDSFVCRHCKGKRFQQTTLKAPVLGDPVTLGVRRLPSGWNQTLSRIKEANRAKDSNVGTQFSSKTEV